MRETKRKPKRFEDDEVLYIKVAENNFFKSIYCLGSNKVTELNRP